MKRPKLSKLTLRRKSKQTEPAQQPGVEDSTPLITTETVAEHRENILSSARKYIYPLQHSKRKIIIISTALFAAATVGFFTYCTLALYRFKTNSNFLYGVTRVIPFPVAKVGSSFVAYENYLFELRHYIHYYQTQQKVDFNSKAGKEQLADYRRRAMQKAVDDVYIKQLAKKNKVSVSERELNDEITLQRSQNRLGANEKVFENVLKDNYGWTVGDFRRSLKQEMLTQKIVAALDTETQAKAQAALGMLAKGVKFKTVAKKYSDDISGKNNGGEYGFLIDKANRDLSAQVTQTLFALDPGHVSNIVNAGNSLEIVKNIDVQGKRIKAAHIVFRFKDINIYLNELKELQKARLFIGM